MMKQKAWLITGVSIGPIRKIAKQIEATSIINVTKTSYDLFFQNK